MGVPHVVRVERARNARLVNLVCQHPAVFGGVRDFRFRHPKQLTFTNGDVCKGLWVDIHVDGQPAAVATFHPLNAVTCQYHGAVLPEFRRHWRAIGRELFDWYFAQGWNVLVALPPVTNSASHAWNAGLGMKRQGAIDGAHCPADGVFEDVTVFSLTKEQWNARRSGGSNGRCRSLLREQAEQGGEERVQEAEEGPG